MFQAIDIIENFEFKMDSRFIHKLQKTQNILITGEGSSRLFPGKQFRYQQLTQCLNKNVVVEGATQAKEYKLDNYAIIGLSNSGQTKELVQLLTVLKKSEHVNLYAVTAKDNSFVTDLTNNSSILSCGKEEAVAASKSVIEQGMFFYGLLSKAFNVELPSLKEFAQKFKMALEIQIDQEIVRMVADAPMIYFAGRNDGVGEELTLKTNEITRKQSEFLEGTYVLHGIEEVMQKGDTLVVIDPFEDEEQKMLDVLVNNIGVNVIAIASRKTKFPTIRIPAGGLFKSFLELAVGWNLLVEVGIFLGVDIDKPVRARKIGNESVAI